VSDDHRAGILERAGWIGERSRSGSKRKVADPRSHGRRARLTDMDLARQPIRELKDNMGVNNEGSG
jgi:hypothetical protein